LRGRLFIAHNARFDYQFLKAEFGRAGIAFDADVLCSLMLSRRLYSQSGHTTSTP
jgi:DNA polymerase-3 subunit epsilon